MKITKIIALIVGMVLLVACKSEQKEPEVISVEYKEEVKKTEIADNATIENAKFNIEGMTCAVGCAAKIEKSLANMDGVTAAKVDFESKTATVSYDAGKVNTGLLAERVVKTGDMYSVMNMEKVSGTKCNKGSEKGCCSTKKEECAKKCASEKSSCKVKNTCKEGAKKVSCAKAEANKSKSSCEKPCCVNKA